MKEFIVENPIFSYISVPILFVVLIAAIIYTLKHRRVAMDYYSGLYHAVLDAIEFIDTNKKSFSKEQLKSLIKTLSKIKFFYEMLESEELYEVEGIISNIDKSLAIARALQTAKSSEGEIADYLGDIDRELKEIRKVLYSFSLTRSDQKSNGFSSPLHLNSKKNKKKAKDFLKNLHN